MTSSIILKKHFEKIGFTDEFLSVCEALASDEMKNLDVMCEMLHSICCSTHEITIYTDFDVDGIMSSVIAYAGFSQLGFNVNLFKPSPSAGYGFRIADVDAILSEFPNTSVIFTGDVGIGCNETIEYARSKRLLVLVTDHHRSSAPCSADIAVNPNQQGETYSHNGICGAYVIYRLLETYAKRYSSPSIGADLYRLRVFAGIATVSDSMPLLYENRQLVRDSISIMRYFYTYELSNGTIAPPVYSDAYSRAFVGLKKLLEYFTTLRKIRSFDDIDEQFYSFYLVPFLNSCKRMDGDMRGVYDIFFSPYVSALPGFPEMSCVETGIHYLEKLNERRKELTESFFNVLSDMKASGETRESAYMQCEVYIADINAGLCGLLANKFMTLSGMPTLVVSANDDGSFSGSGRCPSWFDFQSELQRADIPIMSAGHKEAFGVFIPDIDALNRYTVFYDDVIVPAYEKALAERTVVTDMSVSISNAMHIESDFSSDTALIREYLYEKERFHPFGMGFPAPYFVFYIDPDTVEATMFGSLAQHMRLVTTDGIEILLFNQALDYEVLRYNNKGKKYLFACKGTFKFDNFDNTEYDTIVFLCDEITALEVT